MVKMPDGKITYYWLTADDVPGACGGSGEGACTWEQRLEIDSPLIPNPHELLHAYLYLRKQRHPIPFVAEGMADSIDCSLVHTDLARDVPWPGVVASEETSDSLVQGGALMRYLIRRFGIDAVLRYYDQAPERRDPALYAANFESFWGVTMDDAWAVVHAPTSPGDLRICPCSLPPPAPGGAPVGDGARAPYWTLPETGATVAFTRPGPGLDSVHVLDCAGSQPPIAAPGVVLVRPEGAARRYVLSGVADAAVGDFVADDCASAAPFTLAGAFDATYGFTIVVPSPPASSAMIFLRLESASPLMLQGGAEETCASCAFDQGACQPSTSPVSLQGTTLARVKITMVPKSYSDLAETRLSIR
jgi:hypothetical protein